MGSAGGAWANPKADARQKIGWAWHLPPDPPMSLIHNTSPPMHGFAISTLISVNI